MADITIPQLNAATSVSGTDVMVISQAGVTKKVEVDKILSGVRSDLSEAITALEQEQIQGGVYDVSSHNDGAVFESLSALLSSANLSTLIPTSVRRGGMSIRFIQGSVPNSDNNYVQYRLMADAWSTNTENWAIADEGVYVENPEYAYVQTDNEDKILYGVKQDGEFFFGAGCPQQVKDYIEKRISSSLDEYEDIVAFLSDYLGSDTTLKVMIDSINTQIADKLDEEGLDPNALNSVQAIENSEWLSVTTDNEGRVLGGVGVDGKEKKFLPVTFEANVEVKDITFDSRTRINDNSCTTAITKDYLNRGGIKYYDVSEMGLFIYIRLVNNSDKACTLPIDFYEENKQFAYYASTYFRTSCPYFTDEVIQAENIKYGRLYLKAGEDVTIFITNTNSYKYIGVNTSDIFQGSVVSFEICNKAYGMSLEKSAITMPYLGNGKLYIQPKNYNYGHCARIANIDKYLIVAFSGNQWNNRGDSSFPGYGQFETLAIIEKGNYNNIVYKIFDGNPNDSGIYNYGNANIRICPLGHELNILYYAYDSDQGPVNYYIKKFDCLTFEFSLPQKAYLSYNNTTVEWTKRNELVMLNTLYNAGLEVGDFAVTEIGDMRYYNNYFYTIIGGASVNAATDKYPWTLYKSADCVTWEPVACINSGTRTAELVFDIANDIMLIQIRTNNDLGAVDYNGYMVCDINGNVLKSPTQLSNVDSKGSVFVKYGELYIVYNKDYSRDQHYVRRNCIEIAKLNTEDYSLIPLKTYIDIQGFQYFDFNCKDNVVYMANTEDPRGYCYDEHLGPVGGGISIAIVNEELFNN